MTVSCFGGMWTIAGDYRALSDAVTLTFSETAISVPLSRIYRRVEMTDATGEAPVG